MKKFLGCLGLVLVLFLSGCGKQSNTQRIVNDSYDKKMGIFISPTMSKTIIRQQLSAAKKINVNYVRIPIDQMPFNGQYSRKTKLANYSIKIAQQYKMKVIVDFAGGNPGNYEENSVDYTNIINEIKKDITCFIKKNAKKGIIWESWNEPQGEFWSNKATRNINDGSFVSEWISMNDYIAKTVFKYDRDSEFINGDFSGSPLNNTNFINSVLHSSGMKYSAAISFHPYLKKDLNNGRPEELLNEFPFSSKVPYVVTEFGYPIKTNYSKVQESYLGTWSEKEQAAYLVRATLIFNMMKMPLYSLFTTSLDQDNFGIEKNGKLNLAGKKLSQFNHALKGYSFDTYYRKGETFVVLFHKKYCPYKIIAWSSDDKDHSVIIRNSKVGRLTIQTTEMPKIITRYSASNIIYLSLFTILFFCSMYFLIKHLRLKKG